MRPLETKLLQLANRTDERITYVIENEQRVDRDILIEHIGQRGVVHRITETSRVQDMMHSIMELPFAACYCIDMRHAMNDNKHGAYLYEAIENVKKGWMYDMQPPYRSIFFDRPQIVVFSNHFPDIDRMLLHRWDIYRTEIPESGKADSVDLVRIPPERLKLEACVHLLEIEERERAY